jgi:hypothetical protein
MRAGRNREPAGVIVGPLLPSVNTTRVQPARQISRDAAPSCFKSATFVSTPPGAEKPPSPLADRMRWQGIRIGIGLAPQACPMALAADIGQDLPAAFAFLALGQFEDHADARLHIGQAEGLARGRIGGQAVN